MELKKTYQFDTWNEWNLIIANAAKDFFKMFGYYPNILEANKHTFSQIDFISNIN